MEKVQFHRYSWNFHTSVDLTGLENDLIQLNTDTTHLKSFCESSTSAYYLQSYFIKDQCSNAVELLHDILERINTTFNSFMYLNSAPFNDDNFKLNTIEKGECIYRATSSYATYISYDCYHSNHYKGKVTNDVAIMQSILKGGTENAQKGSKIKAIVQHIVASLTLSTIQLQDRVNVLINHLPTRIFTVEMLRNEIVEIEHFLIQSNKRLPFNISSSSTQFIYNFFTSKCLITDKQLYIVYSLPIVDNESFTLFHFTSFPRRLDGFLFQILFLDTLYLAVDFHKDKFLSIDKKELQRCNYTSQNNLLCGSFQAITSMDDSSSCAVDIIRGRKIDKKCNFNVANITQELWIELEETNSWLICFPHKKEVTIVCSNERDTREISGCTILRLDPYCSVRSIQVEIVATGEKRAVQYKKKSIPRQTAIDWSSIVNFIQKNRYTIDTSFIQSVFYLHDSMKKFSSFGVNYLEIQSLQLDENKSVVDRLN